MIKETITSETLITLAEFPKALGFSYLKYVAKGIENGANMKDFNGCNVIGTFKNLIMNHWKDTYTLELWNQATKVFITNQPSAPIGNETLPTTGILYEVGSEWETNRIPGNPYRISYGITAPEADGLWGSLIWATAQNQMINRVRVPIRKDSGKIIFLELSASMI